MTWSESRQRLESDPAIAYGRNDSWGVGTD
jgi:hypothetical protein